MERARHYLDENRGQRRTLPRPDIAGDGEMLLASMRGRLSRDGRVVLHQDRDQRDLADRDDVAAVATAARSTPDHLLRIGHETLVVDPQAPPDTLESRATLPRIALVPGLGCVAAGANARSARVNAEVATHSHRVTAEVLDVFGEVDWLTDAEIEDFEQWPLELYKLSLAPPPRELESRSWSSPARPRGSDARSH